MDLREGMRARGIPVYTAKSYSLKNDEDQKAIAPMGLDVLFVMGWQRLIPEWFLSKLSIGAFGMHGSSKRLPYGRGRSPLNWSLIQNKTAFFTHLFRYEPGVDDGKVAGVQTFEITPFDTCLTLHHKNTISMIRLVLRLLPDLLSGTAKLQAQPTEGATYYPKRSPDDGAIDWEDSVGDIYNLIRAVTKPFAGAFTFLNNDANQRLTIWRAIPFDPFLFAEINEPGRLLHVFETGEFLVKTGTATLLVQEFEGFRPTPSDVGGVFGNFGKPRKIWENVPL
jgi:UDP-4-amino-4-deoxy-L-arabinose formyltransferase/UDP-glucuronic acid dehydrogenase (UDP-4-keto-hexauronic acid decarboxylating)